MPKRSAPTGRKAWVRNTALRTSDGLAWKSEEMALTQKMRRKKSRLSRVQPRKAAIKVWRCDDVRRLKSRTKDICRRIPDHHLLVDSGSTRSGIYLLKRIILLARQLNTDPRLPGTSSSATSVLV